MTNLLQPDLDALQQTILRFVAADSWSEAKQVLEEHPELLSDEADTLLAQLLQINEGRVRDVLATHRELLRRCRAEGVDTAFAPLLQPASTGWLNIAVPAVFRADFEQLVALGAQARSDPRLHGQRVQLIEGILQHLSHGEASVFRAKLLLELGTSYRELPTGDRGDNVQQAIVSYQEALRLYAREAALLDCAATQNELGLAYEELPAGDRDTNLRQAIACFREALRFYTQGTAPLYYAMSQNNLGNAYNKLRTGDRGANLQQAITCYHEALRFWTPEAAPLLYAAAQHNLGETYRNLPSGDRADNLQRAIACFREALRFRTPEAAPLDYATTQNNLGAAYVHMPTGDRDANLQQAITYFREALRFRTPEAAPFDYAMTQNNLGTAYRQCLTGDRAANLQQAIACFQEALRFHTADGVPLLYAATQNNLGAAYAERPTGDRRDNLRQAVACFQEGLRFYTLEAAPEGHRTTAGNLGKLHFGEHEWQAADAAYASGLAAADALYLTAATEASRHSVLAAVTDLVPQHAYCLARLNRFPEAVVRLEAGRTRALAEALARNRAGLDRATPADREAFAATRERIQALEGEARSARLTTTGVGHLGNARTRSFTELSADLRAARQELADVADRIRAYVPEFMPTGLDFPAIAASAEDPLVYLLAR